MNKENIIEKKGLILNKKTKKNQFVILEDEAEKKIENEMIRRENEAVMIRKFKKKRVRKKNKVNFR